MVVVKDAMHKSDAEVDSFWLSEAWYIDGMMHCIARLRDF